MHSISAAFSAKPAPPRLVQGRLNSLSDEDSGCSTVDDSLTDIRWLGSMDARMNFPPFDMTDPRMHPLHRNLKQQSKGSRICKKLSYGKKEQKSGVHKIRPPFSYAALIALAINSNSQKMLTLNSIYRWIESNFPFFRMPEARAWKNSIRHNLSIKKSLFQKVYIDPPRRGNGAYWTLLQEGLDEVERCMKLFLTLRPPIIDETSAYFNQGSSVSPQVVRSTGQFMPAECEPACSIEIKTEGEESIREDEEEDEEYTGAEASKNEDLNPCIRPYISHTCSLVHPLEYGHEYPHHIYPPSIQPYNPCLPEAAAKPKQPLLPPPPPPPLAKQPLTKLTSNNDDENDTLNSSLLDLSFLTPLKESDNILNSIDLHSLSPYMGYQAQPAPPQSTQPFQSNQALSPLHTPIKLLGHSGLVNDSGIYPSPGSQKFSTPLQDLSEILQLNGFTPSKENFALCHYDPSYHHGNLEQMTRPPPCPPVSTYYYKH